MKNFLPLKILFIISFLGFLIASCIQLDKQDLSLSDAKSLNKKKLEVIEVMKYDSLITLDPKLGYPPHERLSTAMVEAEKRQNFLRSHDSQSEILVANWREKGPNNIGGRTRSIHIDLRNIEGTKVWAGAVTGGLWKTEDISADPVKWEKINDRLENLSISSIGQDPNDPNIMYIGTGETAQGHRGVGVLKSTDGGESWTGLPLSQNFSFRYIQDLDVDPNGYVYVATRDGGLRRSRDGGNVWESILGQSFGSQTNYFYDIEIVDGVIYASDQRSIYKSESGDANTWEDLSNGVNYPNNLGISRVEFDVCESNPNIIFFVGSQGGRGTPIFKSINGGNAWFQLQQLTLPWDPTTEFTRGQAWYDLDIAIDPFDCNRVMAGGVPMYITNDGGGNWNWFGGNSIHVDQHRITFDNRNQDHILIGNDGGIYRTTSGGITIQDRNFGYQTTQFYGVAIHPDVFSDYMLGGTQDNNSLQLNGPYTTSARSVWGGDGVYCFIDQNEPNIQIVSSQGGNYGISYNGGQNFDGGFGVSGNFINVSDYDNDANILYGQTNADTDTVSAQEADFFRWKVNNGSIEFVDISGFNLDVREVFADPNESNTIYIGNGNGLILRIKNANEGLEVTAENLNFPGNGSISGIYKDRSNPNDILVTQSNYGVRSVYMSRDNGGSWESIEGDLPDMPVRDGILDPNDHNRVLLATQLGTWATELVNGDNTKWYPPSESGKFPFVRTDMLQIRESDNVVLAGSYGRGLWVTDVFAEPTIRLTADEWGYVGSTKNFYGDLSYNASNYKWEFNDGFISDEANVERVFEEGGVFEYAFSINDETLTEYGSVTILPDLDLPYKIGNPEYTGGGETDDIHYLPVTISGSGFSRSNSTITGKSGTHSGDFAFVLGANENFYQDNSESYLYTPVFDFSEQNIYLFSFWSKFHLHNKFDGFHVQYSTDQVSWKDLGDADDPNWYNYKNVNLDGGAFAKGKSYFTNIVPGFEQFTKDVSFLSGESRVAFRFLFRSEDSGNHIGIVIDDIEITTAEGDLVTEIVNFSGDRISDNEVRINWSTSPEYHCKRFEVERSINGVTWEQIAVANPTGVITLVPQMYALTDLSLRNLLFYRIKVINEKPEIDYFHEFYSETIVVRRNLDDVEAFQVFPNPFTDVLNISFTDVVNETVNVRLFDSVGRLIYEDQLVPDDVFIQLENLQPTGGIYILEVKIGDRDEQIFKLMSGN